MLTYCWYKCISLDGDDIEKYNSKPGNIFPIFYLSSNKKIGLINVRSLHLKLSIVL